MKKLCMIASFALFLTACQESLEDRCAREAKEYTRKHCPAKIEKNINIDSLTFERVTHTLHYYYTLTGKADHEGIMDEINGPQILLDNLKNSTAMKVYKENHYNFAYTYRSEKNPSIVLMEVVLSEKDYNSSSPSIYSENNNSSKKEATSIIDSVTWKIHTDIDDMTDTKNIWASIRSTNFVNQKFPYQGKTYATITIRYMKKYGYDVIIEIDKGQIVGIDVSGTNYITARFDEGTPMNYYFDDASDGSTEHVFLRNVKDFINRCKKAKDIKVDIPMYQFGKPVFKFHVDKALVWPNQ